MTEDTRRAGSEAQTPAQTAMPFNVYSRHERFVDELALTPHAYRTLAELGLTMIPILHEDEDIAHWLGTADTDLTPDELAAREDAYNIDVARTEYEQRGDDYDPCINPTLEGSEDGE